MSGTSALSIILTQNKLVGTNYVDWKRNLNLVLVAEELKWVTEENCPPVPTAETLPQDREKYDKWVRANDKARCFILASMNNNLQKHHEKMIPAHDILVSLHEMFGEKDIATKQNILRAILNTKMAEGTPVEEHMLKMIGLFNELDDLDSVIDAESKTIMILETLPPSFAQFKLNLSMGKMAWTLVELMNELKAAEAIMKSNRPSVHMVEKGSSSSVRKNKGKKKNHVDSRPMQTFPMKKKQKKKDGKPKGKCFKCGNKGHWRSECPLLKKGIFTIELCSVVDSTVSWVVDSGATDHVCNSMQGFQETRQLHESERFIYLASGARVPVLAIGDVRLDFERKSLELRNCLYVPESRRNLISVSRLANDGYLLYFENCNVTIKLNKDFICNGMLCGNLYHVYPKIFELQNVEQTKTSLKRKEPSINESYLWHLRLGHINLNRIQRLKAAGPLETLDLQPYSVCESCLEGKMTKRPFTAKGVRAKETLDLIHTDVCGPFRVRAYGGYEYFVTFTDDYSRFGYVFLMHRKSEAFDKFKEFKAEAENQLGKRIKSLRSDRGGEYLSGEFISFLREQGIVSQLSAPGTPQQNGVAERRNRTLMEMVRSMLSYSTLPVSFWGYALETAMYVLNLVPSKSIPKTPLEMWSGRKPNLHHIRIWGCPAHVLKRNPDKLEAKTEVCSFVGYPKGTRGYSFYSPLDQKVFVSTNARFLEEDYVMQHKIRKDIDWTESSPTPVITETVGEPSNEVVPSTETFVPRRSGRVVRQPERFMFLGESYEAIPDEHESDPTSYEEALNDKDAIKWQSAMNEEIKSMHFNKVWELVPAPEGIKCIGCKWVYKRKRGSDGKVETYKARLVAKGYTQKPGFDYDETFSPVAMLKSIRILLAIAAFYDYEIWQMDVKTAFLNGDLEENIYMVQPDGFIAKGQEHLVCKLQRSIYGLKQASRAWNIRFDHAVKSFGFEQNEDEPCVYKRTESNKMVFLILYVDDILLIGNDVGFLTHVKIWLSTHFQMKDLGEAQFILGIEIFRDRKNRKIGLSQANYIDKLLVKYAMQDSKKGNLPFRHGIYLSQDQCPKTPDEKEKMRQVPYASAVGSLMYAMLCTRPDISYVVGLVSRYQSNPGIEHWTAVKHIIKYLKRTRDYMLVFQSDELVPIGFTDSDFMADKDSRRSTSGYVFTLGGGAISWRSVKQSCIADSTMEAEYVAASEAAKESVWLRKFLIGLGVVPTAEQSLILYCDNSGAVAQSKEPRNHRKGKHIERKYHLIREIVHRGDVTVSQIASADNLADPFTKTLSLNVFERHREGMGVRCVSSLL